MELSKSKKFLEENKDHEFNKSLEHYLNISYESKDKVYKMLDS